MFEFKWNTAETRERRARIRAIGKGRYIFTRGILIGVLALVIDLAVAVFFEHRRLDLLFVAEKLLQWGLFGPIAAWWSWHVDFDD
jgi:hypothetical protein